MAGHWRGGAPGVQGANFSLTQTGDTLLAPSGWGLTSLTETFAITSIILDGRPGNIAFDRSTGNIRSPASGHVIGIGTAGSDSGGDYTFDTIQGENKGNAPYTVNVTYGNIIGLIGSPACTVSATSPNSPNAGTCGDLFSTLTVASVGPGFVNVKPGVGNHSFYGFNADTDLLGAGRAGACYGRVV